MASAPPQQQQQLTQAPAQGAPPAASGVPPGQQPPAQASAAAGAPQLQAASGLQVAAQAQDFDPVQRFRQLLPQLKESLQVSGRGQRRGGRGLVSRETGPRLLPWRPCPKLEWDRLHL